MSKYDGEMLKEIDDRADLISYVLQNYELERRGEDYYMHCPKHEDKTASLSFSIKNGFYHCFSCGRSGRMIWWLYDYEGLSFDEAVEKAAKFANVDLRKMCLADSVLYLKQIQRKTRIQKAEVQHPILDLSELNKYSVEPAQEWVDEGISPDIMKLFGVRIDKLQNRIIYPVFDIHGNLINIKGRTRYANYKELRLSKYINYFKVGCMDYFQGLNITMPDVLRQREVIIFESIKSVMKAYGWGYRNCVSAETHSMSNEQIDLLLNLKVDVVIAWDSDVNIRDHDVQSNLNHLKQFTNVYFITDYEQLLGGKELKNAPVDCGKETWETLYQQKRKVV